MPLLITRPAPKTADHGHRFVIGIHCQRCGGTNVSRDAAARWSEPEQVWEMSSVQDQGYCDDCDDGDSNNETNLVERYRDMNGGDGGPITERDCFDGETFAERDTLTLSPRELATALAALRYWQRTGLNRDTPEDDIAMDGCIRALTADEIDALCERLNQ